MVSTQTKLLLASILILVFALFLAQLLIEPIPHCMGNKGGRLLCSTMSSAVAPRLHFKCRNQPYPRGKDVGRFPVPDDKVSWDTPFPEYNPNNFTAGSVASGPVWADPDSTETDKFNKITWNTIDGKVERRSHTGEYRLMNGVPCNPVGRTGLIARGALGRWGPNHAADPIVSRWKRDKRGKKVPHPTTGKPVLQFIAIQRKDSGIWAIPGGMVDPGERISVTLKREFAEETMNSMEAGAEESKEIEAKVNELFCKGEEIYRGYVDDPRNTDNSWMETIAVNFHDESGNSVGSFKLNAGDDAVGVSWTDIDKNLQLFASHNEFVQEVVKRQNAHW